MNSLIQADIFFFITSIFIVILTVVLAIGGYYFVRAMKNFHRISDILRNYTEDTEDELRDIGEHIQESPIFTFIFGRRKTSKSTSKKTRDARHP